MNILIINVDYQPQYIGGIKRVSTTLAHQWQAKRHNVYFITECPSVALCGDNIDGISQEILPPPCKLLPEEKIQFLIDKIKRYNIDVLINPHIEERFISKVCFEVRKRTKVKLVSVRHFAPTAFIDEKNAYHNHPSIFMPRGYKALAMRMKWNLITKKKEYAATGKWFREVSDRSDKVVLLSERFIPSWCKMTRVDTDKVTAISNPVTLPKTDGITLSDKQKIVLWCGRVGFGFKRTDYMLGIWRRVSEKHPDWRCVIMGSGDIPRWEAIVKKHGISNIHFTGFCDPTPWYEQGSIFCLTSISEGWGLVLIEAMNYGCTPIAYNSFDSLTDIIDDGKNGFVIPAFDENLYAEKLEWLMEHADERERMQKNGLDTVRKMNNSNIADKWLKLFTEV